MVVGERPATKIREFSDGRIIAIKHQPMPGGGWVATHEDITERRRIEARIAHMAHHDVLTELPNRVLLRERLEQALDARAEGQELGRALPRPRPLQGRQRHARPSGRRRAAASGRRAPARLRRGMADTVARLGGDEFAILQIGIEQPVAATRSGRPHHRGDRGSPSSSTAIRSSVGTSIGIAVSPGDGTEPDQLLKNADLALYRAKSEGRGTYRFFEPEMDAHMQARRKLRARPAQGARATASSSSTTSRSSISSATRSAASRRCCAGTIPSAAWSRRPSSSRSPRRPA